MSHPPAILNTDLTVVEAACMARERGHVLQFNGSSFVLAPGLLPGFIRVVGSDDSGFYAIKKGVA